jgi:hypothetical protein
MLVSYIMTSEFLATYIIHLILKTYLQVRFDWLMRSSKLHFCLELCRSAKAFLKPELLNRKCISL